MISVTEALTRIFALLAPLPTETIALRHAAGRVLAAPAVAFRDQPPFAASAMDGYAIADADPAPGTRYRVIGEAPAGRAWPHPLKPGEAVRIFTGAPVPDGTKRIIIQEDTTRSSDTITLSENLDPGLHIRPAGGDFTAGTPMDAPRLLRPVDIALLAAMNVAEVTVTRRPEIALIATGNELVQPGEVPRPDQITASNHLGLAALFTAAGAIPRLLPIARDTRASLDQAFRLASGADLIVTIGGASVGDHDLVASAAEARGLKPSFYKVAMRPGKPLMAGTIDGTPLIGLPGNPVSSMVCGLVFIIPAIRALLGLPAEAAPRSTAPLAADLPANGPREHYMRAQLTPAGLVPAASQDSSLLSLLASADALLIRPAHDGPRRPGESADYIAL